MKVQELRIGNLVLDPYLNESVVTGIQGIHVWINTLDEKNRESNYLASELSPIPLTPEWLTRAKGLNIGEYAEFATDKLGILWLMFEGMINNEWNPVKSLHQLQNLYFAINGTELQMV